tara:strand:- start:625 stop:1101 length:477 start_codon:yes stop_codon:yes gene_type:complete
MIRTIYKIILILLIQGLTSCGYNPIFSEKNYNFEINQTSFSGEKEINQVIESKFNLIRNNQSIKKKKYDLEINSSKVRKIISKNSKGDPLKFEMNISVDFKIISNRNLLLNKEIKKKSIYNNISDLFELEQNEKIIIENISENISDIIFSSIINLDDN